MAKTLQLKFDPNQDFQLDAIESLVRLVEGVPRSTAGFMQSAEIVSNWQQDDDLPEEMLEANLGQVQHRHKIGDVAGRLEVDEGKGLEGIEDHTRRCPHFTVEMETGTGKTYVYLRTIHELRKRYGFSKYLIVVPSIAIFEGVIKNFKITLSHFRSLYGNEPVHLTQYDGSQISRLRSFAASAFCELMVITLDSFNKKTNNLYKPSEKLPGERLPYQFIQETRPILILDEPQNMESELAKQALRTLHPLFALRFSATHRSSPNLVYRLTPFEAYRRDLVKKIQVVGVTEQDDFNQPFLVLEQVTRQGGIRAKVTTYVADKGRTKEAELTLKQADDLYAKTKRDEHKGGYVVREINAAYNTVEFENGIVLRAGETIGPSRPQIFRVQIAETIEQHMQAQQRLQGRRIKVLSLFFIDRVANYVDEDGLIKRIFDEEFNRLMKLYPFYGKYQPEDVRNGYFAKKKAKKGEEAGEAIDTASRTKDEREAERAAFELIMRDKERLLSFEEPVCFIFAHSALREGWDNPNVFQICTLNQTISKIKKRQEIGRGLRLAVNQDGDRVFSEDVNVLTVVANESYQSYAARLQQEYVEEDDMPPPAPTNARRDEAKRNDRIFYQSQEFRDFWEKLSRRWRYRIHVDTETLVRECLEKLNNATFPDAQILVQRARYVQTRYTMALERAGEGYAQLKIRREDSEGAEDTTWSRRVVVGDELKRALKDDRLGDYKVVAIEGAGINGRVIFGNDVIVDRYSPHEFSTELGQRVRETAFKAPAQRYPIPNLIDRAAKETLLTRPTVNRIFWGMSDRKKAMIFKNPEGFCSVFITAVRNALADHIAERLEFVIDGAEEHELELLFPPKKRYPQRELHEGGERSLYDLVQQDSEVEGRFIERLKPDGKVIAYFKFPPAFKIDLPKIIGKYNPDWGIVRQDDSGNLVLEFVRETKGTMDPQKLQWPHEKRKVMCAEKYFRTLGIDYRQITAEIGDWWRRAEDVPRQGKLGEG